VAKFISSAECRRGGKIHDDSKSQKRLHWAQKADAMLGMTREDCLFKVNFINELTPVHVILDKLPVTNVESSPNEDWHLQLTDDENDAESRDVSLSSGVDHKSSFVRDDTLDQEEVLSSACETLLVDHEHEMSGKSVKPKKRSNIVKLNCSHSQPCKKMKYAAPSHSEFTIEGAMSGVKVVHSPSAEQNSNNLVSKIPSTSSLAIMGANTAQDSQIEKSASSRSGGTLVNDSVVCVSGNGLILYIVI